MVQVKSAWKVFGHRYGVLVRLGRLNRQSGYDVVVIYLAPLDTWYIIPASALKSNWVRLYPHVTNSRSRYEHYREAWRVLTGIPGDDTYRVGLEIHAGRSS